MTSSIWPKYQQELENVKYGWGNEGTEDVPSAAAIEKTKEIVLWAEENGYKIWCLSPDALGGVALYIENNKGVRVQFGIFNYEEEEADFKMDNTEYTIITKESLEWLKAKLDE
jgi:hypothetical protein